MRTSLLLAREPFGRIACETLARYWRARTGREHHVGWHERNPGPLYFQRRSLQAWFGNIYLNFFAVSYAPDAAFEPLRHEYIRSVSRWRRWPQRAYVNYAMSQAGRARLAQVVISTWPGGPEAHDCIIVGGNRRLRLLQPARRTTTVLLKSGFAQGYLKEDVRVRLAMGDALGCAPRICQSAMEAGWYEEEWVSGVPVNRLDPDHALSAVDGAHRLLAKQLVGPTLREESAADYLEQVVQRIASVRTVLHKRDANLEREVGDLQETLLAGLKACGATSRGLMIAATHGDLQPANLLWDGTGVRVIDWENCRRRISGYDALFNAVGMTTLTHWSREFIRLLHAPEASLPTYLREWPGVDWSGSARRVTLTLFLLEQLATVLEEDCEPVFFQPGKAFRHRLPEFLASAKALTHA